MATETFANLPSTTVSSGGTTAPAPNTVETWTVASSSSFPVAATGVTQFHIADIATATHSEMILVTNVAGTTWTVTRGVESTTPVAHSAGFTVTQVVTAGVLGTLIQNPMTTAGDLIDGGTSGAPQRLAGPTSGSVPYVLTSNPSGGAAQTPAWTLAGQVYPWQFTPEFYGAKGDGIMLTDVVMNSSSAVLTSASAPFTTADVGKHIFVNNAGAIAAADTSGGLFSTIASYQSATQVTLANTATRSVTAMSALYGTDDTAAFVSAMAAISSSSYFTTGQHYAELVLSAKCYVLATFPTPGGAGGTTFGNAQIPLPVFTANTGPKRVVVIRGVSDNATFAWWQQNIPQLQGATLFSMIEVTNANHNDPTYGPVSVIGGPNSLTSFTNSTLNNVLAVFDGIQIVCPPNPGQIGLSLAKMAQFAIKTMSIDVFASVTGTPTIAFTGSGPTNSNGQGLQVPVTGLNDRCDIGSLNIQGFYYGMSVDEHIAAQRIAIIYTNTAAFVNVHGGSQASHGCWIGYASFEICNYCVYASGGAGSLFGLYIDNLDNEGPVTAHIYDANNYLSGHVNLLPSQSAALPQVPIVTGAANLEIISGSQTLGHWSSPPAVPLTTVAQLNTAWRHAWVAVHTGAGVTVSVIAVDGTATGLTLAASSTVAVRVPSGKTITLTYAGGTPTWDWWLD